jgi:NAD(P)H-flavin reductase
VSAIVPEPYRVVGRVEEIPEVVTLQVAPVDGELPTFEPAQSGMIGVFGIGEVPISISSDPEVRDHHGYTIRRAGAVTTALTALEVGDELLVRVPFGNAWPIDEAVGGDVLVVAGGIGLAPLRSALCMLVRHREAFGAVRLVVGARSPELLLFADEYERWRAAGIEVVTTIDVPAPGWTGPTGLVTEHLLATHPTAHPLDPTRATAFVCGPDLMMHHVARGLLDGGFPPSKVMLTLERNMRCGVGWCGHCQLGPMLVCRHGPVISYERIGHYHALREV